MAAVQPSDQVVEGSSSGSHTGAGGAAVNDICYNCGKPGHW